MGISTPLSAARSPHTRNSAACAKYPTDKTSQLYACWSYDASYLRALIDADSKAKLQGIVNYRKEIPSAVHAAAGLTAVMQEDCGLCTRLGIDMAQEAGVEPAVLRATMARDRAALPADVALAVRLPITRGEKGGAWSLTLIS